MERIFWIDVILILTTVIVMQDSKFQKMEGDSSFWVAYSFSVLGIFLLIVLFGAIKSRLESYAVIPLRFICITFILTVLVLNFL